MRHKPALAAGPLQRRTSFWDVTCWHPNGNGAFKGNPWHADILSDDLRIAKGRRRLVTTTNQQVAEVTPLNWKKARQRSPRRTARPHPPELASTQPSADFSPANRARSLLCRSPKAQQTPERQVTPTSRTRTQTRLTRKAKPAIKDQTWPEAVVSVTWLAAPPGAHCAASESPEVHKDSAGCGPACPRAGGPRIQAFGMIRLRRDK